MRISTPLIDTYLPETYSKHATGTDLLQGVPVTSMPVTFEAVPANAKSLALYMIDYDAVPVSGFPWIHWVVADLPGDLVLLPEDASRSGVVDMVQGKNSNAGNFVNHPDSNINQRYTGPQPPNADHQYLLVALALDTKLNLPAGFWLNELLHAAAGHVLATAEFRFNAHV